MARRNLMDKIDEVAKKAEIKANVLEYMVVADDDLIDCPENNEDISYTEDLETSMEQIGFSDPLEITDYNMQPGKWMIVSGHRRRAAGRKKGYKEFPAIVRHFENYAQFKNYLLLSNSYRNLENDPFLYTKRFKMHEEYLKEIKFSGDKATEIAKRMGMSRATALRYNQMNKVIMPVWDLVRDKKVGMSNVLFMSSYGLEEQKEIYNMMLEYIENGTKLNEEMCKHIKENYDKINYEMDEQIPGQININKLDEGAYLPDDTYKAKKEDKSKPEITPAPETDILNNEPVKSGNDNKTSKESINNVKEETFFHYLHKVDEYLTSDYTISSKESAIRMMGGLKNMIVESLEEMKAISKKYDFDKMIDSDLNDIEHILNNLKN